MNMVLAKTTSKHMRTVRWNLAVLDARGNLE